MMLVLKVSHLAAAPLDIRANSLNQFSIQKSVSPQFFTSMRTKVKTTERVSIGNLTFDKTIVNQVIESSNPLVQHDASHSVAFNSHLIETNKCSGVIRDSSNNPLVSICFADDGSLSTNSEKQLQQFVEVAEVVSARVYLSDAKSWIPIKKIMVESSLDMVEEEINPSDCVTCPNYVVLTSRPFK